MKKEYLIVFLIVASLFFYAMLSILLMMLWYVMLPDPLLAFVFQGVTVGVALWYAVRQVPWAMRELNRARRLR